MKMALGKGIRELVPGFTDFLLGDIRSPQGQRPPSVNGLLNPGIGNLSIAAGAFC